jgi:hypothetical protein
VGPPFSQRDLGTNRKWKIRLCQEIVEQVLKDEHDAQVPVVRILGEQIGHSLVHVVHLVVYDNQMFFCGIQGVEIWQSLDEFDSIYGSVQRLINVVTPPNFIP